jgi:hypothetical protein
MKPGSWRLLGFIFLDFLLLQKLFLDAKGGDSDHGRLLERPRWTIFDLSSPVLM